MTALLTGIYKNGKIELLDAPPNLREGRVRVLVTEEPEQASPPGQMRFGQFSGDLLPTEEDFKVAEWRGEPEFDNLNGA